MQQFASDFIGKVLLAKDGSRVGYIKNVQTDIRRSRIRNLECCDEEEEEFLLPFSAVETSGKDAVVIKRKNAEGCKNCLSAPFGMAVFSVAGDQLGAIDDLVLEGLLVQGFLLSDGQTVPRDRFVSIADVAVADLSENFQPRPLKCRKPGSAPDATTGTDKEKAAPLKGNGGGATRSNAALSVSRTKEPKGADVSDLNGSAPAGTPQDLSLRGAAAKADQPLLSYAAENERDAFQTEESGGNFHPDTAPLSPSAFEKTLREEIFSNENRPLQGRKTAGSALLTGKILSEDLTDARGTILAKKGTKVTPEIIRRALTHEKLFRLTLLCGIYAKTPNP